MIVILGVASLDFVAWIARRLCRVVWLSCAWYHVTRKMDRGPAVIVTGDALGFIYITGMHTDQAMLRVAANGKRGVG